MTALDRLTFIGNAGLGALLYKPSQVIDGPSSPLNLDLLTQHAKEVLSG